MGTMLPVLGRSNNIALTFYGPGLEQGMPVRCASRLSKGRGHRDRHGAQGDKALIQCGKPNVVTDAEAQYPWFACHDYGLITRRGMARLHEPRPIGDVHIKKVNLSLFRNAAAHPAWSSAMLNPSVSKSCPASRTS